MDPTYAARVQFGMTLAFHYIFPPITIGLGTVLVVMEGIFLLTRKPIYEKLTRFFVKLFGLNFALGVVTGIPMEFQFGTNWAQYSRFVGDVFGSALAAEGIFAFFLESGFLGLLLFGWDKVKPRTHFIATLMVCLGSHFSAIWIIIANSWMQTPAGFKIVGTGVNARAVTTDFFHVVFNPSFINRLLHTVAGAWQAGAFLVLSVCAWYLLTNRFEEFAKAGIRVGLVVAALAATVSIVVGDMSARQVAYTQPAKLAAMEGVYPASGAAGLHMFGWVDESTQTVHGPELPGMLSWLIYFDSSHPVKGLEAFKPEDRPPVNRVFQTFHIMVGIGFASFALTILGLIWWASGKLWTARWLLWPMVVSIVFILLANECGWMTAEWGRQPWIVYGIMRTSEGVSPRVPVGQVWATIVLFAVVYFALLILYVVLLNAKIHNGPDVEHISLPLEGEKHPWELEAEAEPVVAARRADQ
ncbi:MAG TPA: cytochrome ubiquinol oxidase subunit I [Tepidisphaeraceae bacterium]|nr:cytochrome ubiquinol oxidase subunit I [Tepidisphaeraceae bacterium]